MFFALVSKIATEYFISGCTAAISLYCGVKTPKYKRKRGR